MSSTQLNTNNNGAERCEYQRKSSTWGNMKLLQKPNFNVTCSELPLWNFVKKDKYSQAEINRYSKLSSCKGVPGDEQIRLCIDPNNGMDSFDFKLMSFPRNECANSNIPLCKHLSNEEVNNLKSMMEEIIQKYSSDDQINQNDSPEDLKKAVDDITLLSVPGSYFIDKEIENKIDQLILIKEKIQKRIDNLFSKRLNPTQNFCEYTKNDNDFGNITLLQPSTKNNQCKEIKTFQVTYQNKKYTQSEIDRYHDLSKCQSTPDDEQIKLCISKKSGEHDIKLIDKDKCKGIPTCKHLTKDDLQNLHNKVETVLEVAGTDDQIEQITSIEMLQDILHLISIISVYDGKLTDKEIQKKINQVMVQSEKIKKKLFKLKVSSQPQYLCQYERNDSTFGNIKMFSPVESNDSCAESIGDPSIGMFELTKKDTFPPEEVQKYTDLSKCNSDSQNEKIKTCIVFNSKEPHGSMNFNDMNEDQTACIHKYSNPICKHLTQEELKNLERNFQQFLNNNVTDNYIERAKNIDNLLHHFERIKFYTDHTSQLQNEAIKNLTEKALQKQEKIQDRIKKLQKSLPDNHDFQWEYYDIYKLYEKIPHNIDNLSLDELKTLNGDVITLQHKCSYLKHDNTKDNTVDNTENYCEQITEFAKDKQNEIEQKINSLTNNQPTTSKTSILQKSKKNPKQISFAVDKPTQQTAINQDNTKRDDISQNDGLKHNDDIFFNRNDNDNNDDDEVSINTPFCKYTKQTRRFGDVTIFTQPGPDGECQKRKNCKFEGKRNYKLEEVEKYSNLSKCKGSPGNEHIKMCLNSNDKFHFDITDNKCDTGIAVCHHISEDQLKSLKEITLKNFDKNIWNERKIEEATSIQDLNDQIFFINQFVGYALQVTSKDGEDFQTKLQDILKRKEKINERIIYLKKILSHEYESNSNFYGKTKFITPTTLTLSDFPNDSHQTEKNGLIRHLTNLCTNTIQNCTGFSYNVLDYQKEDSNLSILENTIQPYINDIRYRIQGMYNSQMNIALASSFFNFLDDHDIVLQLFKLYKLNGKFANVQIQKGFISIVELSEHEQSVYQYKNKYDIYGNLKDLEINTTFRETPERYSTFHDLANKIDNIRLSQPENTLKVIVVLSSNVLSSNVLSSNVHYGWPIESNTYYFIIYNKSIFCIVNELNLYEATLKNLQQKLQNVEFINVPKLATKNESEFYVLFFLFFHDLVDTMSKCVSEKKSTNNCSTEIKNLFIYFNYMHMDKNLIEQYTIQVLHPLMKKSINDVIQLGNNPNYAHVGSDEDEDEDEDDYEDDEKNQSSATGGPTTTTQTTTTITAPKTTPSQSSTISSSKPSSSSIDSSLNVSNSRRQTPRQTPRQTTKRSSSISVSQPVTTMIPTQEPDEKRGDQRLKRKLFGELTYDESKMNEKYQHIQPRPVVADQMLPKTNRNHFDKMKDDEYFQKEVKKYKNHPMFYSECTTNKDCLSNQETFASLTCQKSRYQNDETTRCLPRKNFVLEKCNKNQDCISNNCDYLNDVSEHGKKQKVCVPEKESNAVVQGLYLLGLTAIGALVGVASSKRL